jgi:hypothetical protein
LNNYFPDGKILANLVALATPNPTPSGRRTLLQLHFFPLPSDMLTLRRHDRIVKTGNNYEKFDYNFWFDLTIGSTTIINKPCKN